MKKKIVGMFVCTLLIATILPITGNVIAGSEEDPEVEDRIFDVNMFCKGFKSPPFKAIFHAGISGLRSPGIYAWEEVTPFHTSLMKISYIWR